MLVYKINKEKDPEPIKITYNQRTISIEPGKSLDVRDFGVGNEGVAGVERHLLFKYPDTFEQKKTKDILETNKAHLEKISILEAANKELAGNIVQLEKTCKSATDKMNKVLAENEGFKSKNKSLTNEVGELKAKLKAAL